MYALHSLMHAFFQVSLSLASRVFHLEWAGSMFYKHLLFNLLKGFTKPTLIMLKFGNIDLKNIELDAKIIILSALVQKLRSKTSFCIMVVNVMLSCTSHVQTDQDIF